MFRIFNYAVVQLAPIMINTIAWKTYFVFFCFNVAFIPLVYFFLPETNGWKLETLDAIFTQAHEKGENPVFTERRWRKSGWKHKRDSLAPTDAEREMSDSDETKVIEAGGESQATHLEEKTEST